jgi:hypothetical protein
LLDSLLKAFGYTWIMLPDHAAISLNQEVEYRLEILPPNPLPTVLRVHGKGVGRWVLVQRLSPDFPDVGNVYPVLVWVRV